MIPVKIGVSDYVSTSHFPVLLAQELGLYRKEGLDVAIQPFEQAAKELVALRDGEIDLASVGAHHPLSLFKDWKGAKLLMAVGQRTPWTLIVRADLKVQRGEFNQLRGLKIGAAPEPGKALLYILRKSGIDVAKAGISITAVPGALDPAACTGVAAARALQAKLLDGFWANELGAALAVQGGVGKVFADVRHGDGPPEGQRVSFTALVGIDKFIADHPDRVSSVIRAVVKAEKRLREFPEESALVAQQLFPKEAALVVPGIVKANTRFYYPAITEEDIRCLHEFAKEVGLLATDVPYEEIVALQFMPLWETKELIS